MFTVNGKELDYDIFDADKADLIQRVMEETFQKIASIDANSPENTWAGFVREICEAVAAAFDRLWGAGTAVKILTRGESKSRNERISGVGGRY